MGGETRIQMASKHVYPLIPEIGTGLTLDKEKIKLKLISAGYKLVPRMNPVWDQFCPVGAKIWNEEPDYPLYEDNLFFRDRGKQDYYDAIQGKCVIGEILYREELEKTQLNWLLHNPVQLRL